jgi:hypothetical protein
MDPRRFEELSRRVAQAESRRAAMKTLAAALAAPVLLRATADEAAAGIPIANCKLPGKKCSSDRRCCSQRCKKGRCICSKKGRPCWAPLEGALCCSRRCQGGKCA